MFPPLTLAMSADSTKQKPSKWNTTWWGPEGRRSGDDRQKALIQVLTRTIMTKRAGRVRIAATPSTLGSIISEGSALLEFKGNGFLWTRDPQAGRVTVNLRNARKRERKLAILKSRPSQDWLPHFTTKELVERLFDQAEERRNLRRNSIRHWLSQNFSANLDKIQVEEHAPVREKYSSNFPKQAET